MILILRARWLILVALLFVAGGLLAAVRPVMRLFYPLQYQEPVLRYAAVHQLDPLLLMAVIRVESRFDPRARSHKGAVGLMQLMPETAQWAAEQMRLPDFSLERLEDPEINVQIGAWYLASLRNQFGGDLVLALAAYNGGEGNVRRWLQERRWSGQRETLHEIPYRETREYVRKVLVSYQWYRRLYGSQLGRLAVSWLDHRPVAVRVLVS